MVAYEGNEEDIVRLLACSMALHNMILNTGVVCYPREEVV
jgi:hypothetical protein